MKKFIYNSILFISIFSVFTFLVDCINISDEYIIQQTNGPGYNKIAWNLNLINNNPEKINGSIVFLGPSFIQGGICDSTLISNGIKAINMGVNHTGNEMALFFLNKILKYNPRKVYLNISKAEVMDLHSLTPLLFTPISLIQCGQDLNFPFIKYVFKRLPFVLKYLKWCITDNEEIKENYADYGVEYGKWLIPIEIYNAAIKDSVLSYNYSQDSYQAKFKKWVGTISKTLGISTIKSYLYNNKHSQQVFVNYAYKKCMAHNVKFAELYVPVVADAKNKKNFDSSFYSAHNIFPVESIRNFYFLDQANNWTDLHHLSKKGAILFTSELIKQGVVELQKK